ncbi:MAG: cytochrome b/b6 domain-containing protein [Burkholderiales bacterium]|nr:cytochrome b/b6 domain-containing protein [Burkholderiales bacterium]
MTTYYDTPPRWPTLMIAIHWLTAFIVLTVFALALSREFVEVKETRQLLLQLHRYAGIIAFALVLVRIPTRITSKAPDHDFSGLTKLAAAAGHAALYIALAAIPLLGYLLTCARTGHVDFLGVPLPVLLERDRDVAETLELYHSYAGWAMLTIVGLHALAALLHHHVFKDDVLKAMWPRNSQNG